MRTVDFRLKGLGFFDAPSVVAMHRSDYLEAKADDSVRQEVAGRFAEVYGLPENVAQGLLSGEIDPTVDGATVVFQAEVPDDWCPAGTE